MKLTLTATIQKTAEHCRIFLYHGVKDSANVNKILEGGFDLTKIQSEWISGYGVSCFSKAEGVRKWFRNPNIPIIQMTFDGNLITPWDAEDIIKPRVEKNWMSNWSPQQYNLALIDNGIDAVWMESPFKGCKEIRVHNLLKIHDLKLL